MSNGATRYPHMGVGSGVGFTVMWCWMPELRKRSPALDSSGDDRRFHATSPTLKTPRRHLLPWNPPRAPPRQALTQGHPDLTLFERGAGRERRGRNLRPLPRPMDGSNSAIERYLSQAQALSASSSKVCSQKNPWRVRLRQGHTSRRS